LVEGDSPTNANALVYLPPRGAYPFERFREIFEPFGAVVVPS
jgi:hypothetical protein